MAGHADLAAADRRAQDGQHQLLNGWTGLRCLVLEGADKGGGGVFRSKDVPPPHSCGCNGGVMVARCSPNRALALAQTLGTSAKCPRQNRQEDRNRGVNGIL